MAEAERGIVKIRRSWTEEGVQLAIGVIVTLIMSFGFGKYWLLVAYLPWTAVFLSMNRRMGIDLTASAAIVRTMFWRSRRVRREDITDVVILKQGASSFVALHVRGAKRPIKLTIKNALGPWGNRRIAQTHARIRQWWLDAPRAVDPVAAQMPGSANI